MFIEFTKYSGEKIVVNKNAISAVTVKDNRVVMYVIGDSIPFELKDSYNMVTAYLLD
ncbi:hypothetical protein [Gorillibacterium sp. sgz5001074]|uniref:hypothetical protein n=1 Tax=Gorillibacterium sp. sgz5001074 TaxID=3446695 RepID=UPI003F660DC4